MARMRSARHIPEDAAYLAKIRDEFQSIGIPVEAELAYGDPVKEIVKWVEQKGCDLVAMSTHGHRFIADLFVGTTVSRVQHSIGVPVLLLQANAPPYRRGYAIGERKRVTAHTIREKKMLRSVGIRSSVGRCTASPGAA
jgi:Universal stress protein family